MLNKVILLGRLVTEPELRPYPFRHSSFELPHSVDRNLKSQSGERQTDFIDIVAWR
jgi:single-strand DNA-binding protein